MPVSVTITDPRDLSDRQLLLLFEERTRTMSADLSALQAAVTDLQSTVTAMKPVLDASVALGARAITELETLAAQVAGLPTDAAAIAQLAQNIGDTVAALKADQTQVVAANTAVQAELDKVAPPAPPVVAP